jgi:hypothetical protein
MRLAEVCQIAAGFGPVDMNTAANNGDWVSMKNYQHLTVLFFKGVGTAGDDPILKLQQAKDVAGDSVKDLLFTEIFVKAGTLTSIGEFTKVTQAAATQYTNATHAEVAAIYAVEIDAEMLDSDGGFDCVQASVADVSGGANPQLGALLYILSEPRHTPPPSAIVD